MAVVREGHLKDLSQIMALSREMHFESVYRDIEINENKLRGLLEQILTRQHPKTVIYVSEKKSAINGFLIGYVDNYFFSDEVFAQDLIYYVSPEARGSKAATELWAFFRKWAQDKKAFEINMSVSTGNRLLQSHSFYEHLGFVHVGGIYKFRL